MHFKSKKTSRKRMFENMRNIESTYLFFEVSSRKQASKFDFIDGPVLPGK